ncbi:MAG: IS200/IS605 family transposase [Acidobacteriota bacterium]|nr:MAG: IS200/IS605 family transposase [Acidobacteriota bacterium]
MANTYSNLFNHIVFSTKGRKNLIDREIESRVWAYIGGIARNHEIIAVQVGGTENHIHVLIMAKPKFSPSQIVQWLKGESSRWISEEFSHLRKFAWQDGYGVFSVSKSNVPSVIEYIRNQREHHRRHTFEDEYVSLLKLHGIDYDERYLFD